MSFRVGRGGNGHGARVGDDVAVEHLDAPPRLAATARSWVMMTTVVPAAFSSSSRPRIDAPVAESRLPVGSSASTTGGRPAIARAIATRCRSPPDSWVGRAAARCPSPTRSSAAAASRRRSARRTPA